MSRRRSFTKLAAVACASAVAVVGLNGVASSAPRVDTVGVFDPNVSVVEVAHEEGSALHHHGKGNRDARKGRQGPSARQIQLAEQANLRVDWNQFGTPYQVSAARGGALATGLSTDPETAARAYLANNRELFGLSGDAINSLELVSVNPIGDGHAVQLRQTFGGLPAGNDGIVKVGVKNGSVVYASSSLARKAPKPQAMTLTEVQGIQAAARDAGMTLGTLTEVGESDGWNRYSASALEGRQSVRKVAVPMPDGSIRAAYEVGLNNNGDDVEAYTSYVDGRTGEVLIRQDNVHSAIDNPEWKVFPNTPPLNYSSTDTRQTWCWGAGPSCDRAVANPSSPLGWDIDPGLSSTTSSFTARGNNAQTARTWTGSFSLNNVPAQRPNRDYTPEWTNQWHDMACHPDAFTTGTLNDIDAAIYNLNAMHNRMHDFSYKLGFTELNRNMQVTNFGLGARENDPERGNAQSGARSATLTRNNANQSTPTDGSPGSTNMYLWQPVAGSYYAPCVDGDFDMSVIAHEYGHAISNRMVSGGLSGHQAGAMGESWSDLQALEYLDTYGFVEPGHSASRVGSYVTGNKLRGIRNYDMADNPLNYSNLTYDLVGTNVHADGEIWSATNYDLREAFKARYGAGTPELKAACSDGLVALENCPGNRHWFQLVYDAWLLMPRTVSMVAARDAMLAADQIRFDGRNAAMMWDVFAKRGLGVGAASNSSTDLAPKPSFETTTSNNGTIRFDPVGDAAGISTMKVYVGDYHARSRHIADTDPATEITDTATMVAGTYRFVAQAPGFGMMRFTATVPAGQSVTVPVKLERNVASSASGARAYGDGVNHAYLIDDSEATQWSYLGAKAEPVAGKTVTVELAETSVIRRVQVSALLRAATTGDPAGDNAAHNRFTALRSFKVLACVESASVDCKNDADFRVAYTSPADAFPSEVPRPVAPTVNMRSFDIPATPASHLRIEVVSSQCTGNPLYLGEQSRDPNVPTDCATEGPESGQVRIAEFQAFAGSETAPGAGADQIIVADVAGSPLTMEITGSLVTMPATTLTGFDQVVDGALNSTIVRDPRGTNAGWSLTGQVSDFVAASGLIVANNLGWTPTARAVTGSLPTAPGSASQAVPGQPAPAGSGLGSASVLCLGNAGSSAGAFECGAGLHLGIPGNTPVGTYTGVLTLTLV